MEISLAAEPLFYIRTFPITNTLVVTIALGVFILSISFLIKKRLALIPQGVQNVVEYTVESILNLVNSVTQDRKQTEKFFPLVTTIFIFVILSNWIELIPGLGTIGLVQFHEGKKVIIPFLRSASADLNVTLALALVSVITIQVMGITAIGLTRYVKKFFVSPFYKPYFIGTFVGILELISEVAKIVSFSFRLFGNIFAGEVLLIVMLTLVPYLVPLPFLLLEIFVGFIQALVFSMLTLVFLKIAVTETQH
jgi:F-type H+-transporting ATPase subunit a